MGRGIGPDGRLSDLLGGGLEILVLGDESLKGLVIRRSVFPSERLPNLLNRGEREVGVRATTHDCLVRFAKTKEKQIARFQLPERLPSTGSPEVDFVYVPLFREKLKPFTVSRIHVDVHVQAPT